VSVTGLPSRPKTFAKPSSCPALELEYLVIFRPVADLSTSEATPVSICKSPQAGGRNFQSSKFPFSQRFYEKQSDHFRNTEIVCRRDCLQHVGRDCHAIYFTGFGPIVLFVCETFRSVKCSFSTFFSAPGELRISIAVEVDVKIARTGAVTVRLDPELKGRLAQAAAKLDLSENDIVRHALRAAVNAIEANDYKIELPLEMALAKTPN
jgi:hypothetical protein